MRGLFYFFIILWFFMISNDFVIYFVDILS